MAAPGLILFHEDLAKVKDILSTEELGSLILALDAYMNEGTEPSDLTPIVLLAYRMLEPKIAQQMRKYVARVEAGRKGGEANGSNDEANESNDEANESKPEANESNSEANESKRGKPKTKNLKPITNNIVSTGVIGGENAPDGADNTHKRGKFEPPTLEEAQAYAREKGMDMDVEKFMAFYETNGWKVGRNPMKNWHSAMVYWHKNNSQRAREPTRYVPPVQSNRGLEDWDR